MCLDIDFVYWVARRATRLAWALVNRAGRVYLEAEATIPAETLEYTIHNSTKHGHEDNIEARYSGVQNVATVLKRRGRLLISVVFVPEVLCREKISFPVRNETTFFSGPEIQRLSPLKDKIMRCK